MTNSHIIDSTSQNSKRHPLSIVSVVLAALSIALLVVTFILVILFPPPEGHYSPLLGAAGPFVLIAVLGSACLAPLGFITGIVSWYMIAKGQGRYYGKWLTWIGMALSGVIIMFFGCPSVLTPIFFM